MIKKIHNWIDNTIILSVCAIAGMIFFAGCGSSSNDETSVAAIIEKSFSTGGQILVSGNNGTISSPLKNYSSSGDEYIPLSGAIVNINGKTAVTNSNGYYRIDFYRSELNISGLKRVLRQSIYSTETGIIESEINVEDLKTTVQKIKIKLNDDGKIDEDNPFEITENIKSSLPETSTVDDIVYLIDTEIDQVENGNVNKEVLSGIVSGTINIENPVIKIDGNIPGKIQVSGIPWIEIKKDELNSAKYRFQIHNLTEGIHDIEFSGVNYRNFLKIVEKFDGLNITGINITLEKAVEVNDFILEIVSGDHQYGEPGKKLREPVKISLKDSTGLPVSGVKISFIPETSHGYVDVRSIQDGNQTEIITDSRGTGICENWITGDFAGNQKLGIKISGSNKEIICNATVRELEVSAINMISSIIANKINEIVNLEFQVLDKNNNPLINAPVEMKITNITETEDETELETDSVQYTDNMGTIRNTLRFGVVSGKKIINISVPGTGFSREFEFTALADEIRTMEVFPQSPVEIINSIGEIEISVIFRDEYGNVTGENIDVELTVQDPDGSNLFAGELENNTLKITNGMAKTVLKTGTNVNDNFRINAVYGSYNEKSGIITVTDSGNIGFRIDIVQEFAAGDIISFSISAVNSNNEVLTSYSGDKILEFTGAGDSSNGDKPVFPQSVFFQNGVARNLQLILKKSEEIKIAVKENINYGESETLKIKPGELSKYIVVMPEKIIADNSTEFTVEIKGADEFGNITSGGSSVSLTALDKNGEVSGNLSGRITGINLVSGKEIIDNLKFDKVDSIKIQASDSEGIKSVLSETETVITEIGTALEYRVTTVSKIVAGEEFNMLIEAIDLNGNILSGINSDLNISLIEGDVNYSGTGILKISHGRMTNGILNISAQSFTGTGNLKFRVDDGVNDSTGEMIEFLPSFSGAIKIEGDNIITAGNGTLLKISIIDEFGNEQVNENGFRTLEFSGLIIKDRAPLIGGQNSDAPVNLEFINGVAETLFIPYISGNSVLSVKSGILSSENNTLEYTVKNGKIYGFSFEDKSIITVKAGEEIQNLKIIAFDEWQNKMEDYNGIKNVRFSNAGISPDGGDTPSSINGDGINVEFGNSAELNFSRGESIVNLRLFKAEETEVHVSLSDDISVSSQTSANNGLKTNIVPDIPGNVEMSFREISSLNVVNEIMDRIIVSVVDQYGNTFKDNTAVINLSLAANTYGAVLSGTKSKIVQDGLAEFDDLVIDKLGEKYQIVATCGSCSPVMSEEFNIVIPAPEIISVDTVKGDGIYKNGESIIFTVKFNKSVIVKTDEGVPYIQLNSSGKANYRDGSGTDILNFEYIIADGENTDLLKYETVDSLKLNMGSITNVENYPLVNTLPDPLIFAGNHNIAVDTESPAVSFSEKKTNDRSPELTGTVDDGSAVISIIVNGNTYAAVNNGDGTWILNDNVISELADGEYTVKISAVDPVLNEGSKEDKLIIDTIAPAVTVDSILTNNQNPELTGTVDDNNAVIILKINGEEYNAVNEGDGRFRLAENSLNTTLAEGNYDLIVKAVDEVGNAGSDISVNEITIDLTPPEITVNIVKTNDTTPDLSGTIDDNGAVIKISIENNEYSAVNNGDGTWTLGGEEISQLSEKTYDIVAEATDSAGNKGSDTTSEELVIDITPPVVKIDKIVTNDRTPEITGTINDNEAIVSAEIGGETYNVHNNEDGTWIIADNTVSEFDTDSVNEVKVTATDIFGNSSTDDSTSEIVIDNVAPVVTVNELTTENTSPQLTGVVDDAEAEIRIKINNGEYSAVNNGDGTWTLAENVIIDLETGLYDIEVSAKDKAGNTGKDSSLNELFVEGSGPEINVDSVITNKTRPEITGTVENSAVEVYVTILDKRYTCEIFIDGTWKLASEIVDELAEGVYNVTGLAVDYNGNSKTERIDSELTIDLTPPEIIVNKIETREVSPELTGTVSEIDVSVQVIIESRTYIPEIDSDGTWKIAKEIIDPLKIGKYNVYAIVIDKAGNRKIDSSSEEIIITE